MKHSRYEIFLLILLVLCTVAYVTIQIASWLDIL